jgi:isocitrate dehydrogenase
MPAEPASKRQKVDASEKIMYTYTDEAPMLATHAFFPIVKAFCHHANVDMELKDISVAGRVIANFSDLLPEDKKMDDILSQLGTLAQSGDANIIKLPNISASIPQLKECIKELQGKGYKLPDYPEDAKDAEAKDVKARYAKILGSAVNPVLREGNSDRRAAVPVKEYAYRYPHKMGSWEGSKTCVRSMQDGDFYSHERSVIVEEDCVAQIELIADDGTTQVLREKLPLQKGDVLDATFMDCRLLAEFYEECIQEAKDSGVLFSLHLKATMMKVSDPIMFGHCVRVYFKDVFAKYADTFATLGVDANNGLGDVYKKIAFLPAAEKAAIEADIMATYEKRGAMAMVDGGKGITNLHVPSDIIIDNSMPTAIRDGGKMWNRVDKTEDFLATIPDRGYGCVFDEVVKFCQKNGAFDPKTMGGCPNVGLMAQKAEEYGSHPNTFEVKKAGTVRIVVKDSKEVLIGQKLDQGDIYRACVTKDAPIKDWVKLAVARCRANNFPAPSNAKPCKAIFWLDSARSHDTILMRLVRKYLKEFDTQGLDLDIMSPVEAMRVTCQRAKEGLNTITVTGNVLRDYLTDLFPILELNTSAKMLSIVPMLTGGAMYETGAGGSAPKHVQQFQQEGHLRWDSLGEYLALSCAFVDLGERNPKAKCLAAALDTAVGTFLVANKNPGRKVKEIDNRGSHYWVARYWAEELAKSTDSSLKSVFSQTSKELVEGEAKILQDMIDCQGTAIDLGGYYKVDHAKADKAMQPSHTFNSIIERLSKATA